MQTVSVAVMSARMLLLSRSKQIEFDRNRTECHVKLIFSGHDGIVVYYQRR